MAKGNEKGRDERGVLRSIVQAEHEQGAEQQIENLGRELLSRFFTCIRLARLHASANQALVQGISGLQQVLAGILELESGVDLQAVGEAFYLNKKPIKVDFSSFESAKFLLQLFQAAVIGGFRCGEVPTPEALEELARALAKVRKREEGEGGMERLSFGPLTLHPLKELKEVAHKEIAPGQARPELDASLRLYCKLQISLQLFIQGLKGKKSQVALAKIKRLLHELVEALGQQAERFLALISVKNPDQYLAAHSLNTAVLAVLLGQKIGLSRQQQSELGMAALFHDLGLADLPAGLLDKSGPLTKFEKNLLRNRPRKTVQRLLQMQGFHQETVKRLLVAFEHAQSGGAVAEPGYRPLLFSRIVSLACCYEAMTTPRSFRDCYLPDEALRVLLKNQGGKFDPALLQLFASMLGLYPVGTAVVLDSGEIGVVCGPPQDPKTPDKPKVLVVLDSLRRPKEHWPLVNLAYSGRILKSVDPAAYQINPAHYLLRARGG